MRIGVYIQDLNQFRSLGWFSAQFVILSFIYFANPSLITWYLILIIYIKLQITFHDHINVLLLYLSHACLLFVKNLGKFYMLIAYHASIPFLKMKKHQMHFCPGNIGAIVQHSIYQNCVFNIPKKSDYLSLKSNEMIAY